MFGLQTSREVGIGYERATKRKRSDARRHEPARLTDALGAVPSVMFSPADVALVRGAPGERRRFLDIMLGVTSQPYLRSLQAYRAALARRNAALRSGGPIAVWEPPLAHHGAIIWRERVAWVSDLRRRRWRDWRPPSVSSGRLVRAIRAHSAKRLARLPTWTPNAFWPMRWPKAERTIFVAA